MPGICQVGRGRRFGRWNSQGRYSALPFCSSGQSQTSRSTYPRQRSGILVDSDGRTHHLQHPRGSFGSAVGRARRYESPLCGQPSQCGYGVTRAFGQARGAPYSSTNEGGVRRPALFPRVRRRLTAARGLRARERGLCHAGRLVVLIRPDFRESRFQKACVGRSTRRLGTLTRPQPSRSPQVTGCPRFACPHPAPPRGSKPAAVSPA